MPNCFTLTRKSDLDAGPVSLSTIDEEICAHLGVPVHPKDYVERWFDTIGLGLAMGCSFEKLRGHFPNKLAIINFLDENFTPDAWAERGRIG